MKKSYLLILISFIFFTSCIKVIDCPADRLKSILESELHEFNPKDSTKVVARCVSDSILVWINIPASSATSTNYNKLLLSHIFYKLYKNSDTAVSTWIINVLHNYNNENYSVTFTKEENIEILLDNQNSKYRMVTKFLLENLNDSNTVFYDLGMEEARKLFPGATFEYDIFTLFTGYPFKDDKRFYNEIDIRKMEFEIKLFYWISQFPYGDLSFDRKILDSLIEILEINKDEEWNKKYLKRLYSEMKSKSEEWKKQ